MRGGPGPFSTSIRSTAFCEMLARMRTMQLQEKATDQLLFIMCSIPPLAKCSDLQTKMQSQEIVRLTLIVYWHAQNVLDRCSLSACYVLRMHTSIVSLSSCLVSTSHSAQLQSGHTRVKHFRARGVYEQQGGSFQELPLSQSLVRPYGLHGSRAPASKLHTREHKTRRTGKNFLGKFANEGENAYRVLRAIVQVALIHYG
jgi:hypothetical protein